MVPPQQPAMGSGGSSYVRLRGLPFAATEQEVAQWFGSAPGSPIQARRVIFTYNTTGRKSGEAYVELPEMAAERAVQTLNHRNMGTRYVEVFLSSEGEMNQANVAPPAPTGGPGWGMGMGDVGSNGIVRLRGLPFNTTPELILAFFQGYDVPKGTHGVHLILGPNGRPNGEAFIEFVAEEVADAALSKDRGTIGTRYVEVFRATPEQMTMAMQRVGKSNNLAPGMHAMHPNGAMAHHGMQAPYGFAPYGMAPQMGFVGGMGPGADAVVKMRGLPYKVTRNDILDFFTGLSVPLNGVHLMFNEREQPTGEAYVEFASPEDRERAMTKDRQHIGGRYVELFRVSRGELIAALEQFVGGYMSNQMVMAPNGMGAQAYGGMYGMPHGSPYGQPYAAGPGAMGYGAHGAMQQHMGMGMQAGAHGMAGVPNGGTKGSTLRMRGIPFRSTVEDVMRFFAGFQVIPGGVVIGQRDGRATGDCFVTFTSPAEAQRATIMNNKHMGTRYVELFNA